MKFYFFIIVFLTFSCAKPHYVDDKKIIKQEEVKTCDLYFKENELCLFSKWEVFPNESQFGQMKLTFTERNDDRVLVTPKYHFEMILWMPSMGHGSSPVSITPISKGVFRASEIFFIMPGAWEIRFQLKDEGKIVEEVIQNITI
jgi:hypothetical protein